MLGKSWPEWSKHLKSSTHACLHFSPKGFMAVVSGRSFTLVVAHTAATSVLLMVFS